MTDYINRLDESVNQLTGGTQIVAAICVQQVRELGRKDTLSQLIGGLETAQGPYRTWLASAIAITENA